MALDVRYLPTADADLASIFDWLSERSDADRAFGYIDRIQTTCERLMHFAERGTLREELELGLRSIPFKRRATIYYRVVGGSVEIVRVLYAGMDAGRAFGTKRN